VKDYKSGGKTKIAGSKVTLTGLSNG